MNLIKKNIVDEKGVEREIKIFPLQIMEFFDLMIFDNTNHTIVKQTKNGTFVDIYLKDAVEQNADLNEESEQIVFEALRDYVIDYGKENNMKILNLDTIIYIIDNDFLESINNIIDTSEGFKLSTNFIDDIKYENYLELKDYIKDFLFNKAIEKELKINNFLSKEPSLLKKELELLTLQKEKDVYNFHLKNLETENKCQKTINDIEHKCHEKINDIEHKYQEKINDIEHKYQEKINDIEKSEEEKISLLEKEVSNISINNKKIISQKNKFQVLFFIFFFISIVLFSLNYFNIKLSKQGLFNIDKEKILDEKFILDKSATKYNDLNLTVDSFDNNQSK